MEEIQYLKLPIDLKKEIQKNLKINSNLKSGFYSELYSINVNGKECKYRFHSTEFKKKKSFVIIFSRNIKEHKPFIEKKSIFFYDKGLNNTLKVDSDLVQSITEKEINFNLSNEQKELLFLGHDITLEVNQKNKKEGVAKTTIQKSSKNYTADYSFFLGKSSLLIKENLIEKENKFKINILKHERG